MGVMERYNQKKNQQATGVAERYEKHRYYQTLDTDSVNDSYINSFTTDAKSFFTQVVDMSISYTDANNMLQDLGIRYDTIQGWLYKNRSRFDEKTYQSFNSFFDGLQSSFDNIRDYYSKWDSEEAYQQSVDAYKLEQEQLAYDTVAGEQELSGLEALYTEGEKLMYLVNAYVPDPNTLSGRNKVIYEMLQEHGGLDALNAKIAEKRVYLRQAKELQERYGFEAVGDSTSEYYDPDFAIYSQNGANLENPSWEDSKTPLNLFGWKPFGDGADITNMVTFAEANADEISKEKAQADYSASVTEERYEFLKLLYAINTHMRQEEKDVYNYYIGRGDTEKANKYLASLKHVFDQREAGATFKTLKGKFIPEMIFGVAAGLDQFASGVRNLFNNEDEYIPPSTMQMVSGMVREDLGNIDLKWYNFKEGQWNDADIFGRSLGQFGYDAVTTTANMAPSILASIGIGLVNPTAGMVAGNVLLGASAAGNAYQEKLNLGWSKEESRTYGLMVGTSEAVLQALLGGIGKLGKSALTSTVLKNLDAVDNVFARFAKSAGGKFFLNGISEGFEEGLQSVIEPYLWQAVSGVEASVDWQETMYDSLMGFVTSNVFNGIDSGINASFENARFAATGEAIINTEGGADALKNLSFDVASVAAPDIQSKINKQASKVSSGAATGLFAKTKNAKNAINAGRLYNTVQTAVGTQNHADIVKSLTRGENAFTKRQASEIAGALIAQANGLELTTKQSKLLDSVKDNPKVQKALDGIIHNEKSTVGQRYQKLADFSIGVATERFAKTSGVDVETASSAEESIRPTEAKTIPEGTESFEEVDFETSTDGKTVYKGEEVSVQGVAAVKGGRLMLQLSNGQVADASEISYASESEALIYQTVSRMNISPHAAGILVNSYLKQDSALLAEEYAKGIEEAYRYGQQNIDESKLAESTYASKLNPGEQGFAYRQGQKAAGKEVGKKEAANKNRGVKSGKYYKEFTKEINGVHYDDVDVSGRKLNKYQRTGIQLAEFLAALGFDVHVFESPTTADGKHIGENGSYHSADGSIHIDLAAGNLGEGLMAYTLSHELTHDIEDWSPAKFKAFANLLFAELGKSGKDVDAWIQEKLEQVRKMKEYKGMTEQQLEGIAYSEVVAECCETMLTDTDVAAKIVEKLRAQDKQLFNRVKQFFQQLLTKLKGWLKVNKAYLDANPDSRIAAEARQTLQNVETLVDLFADAAVDAAKNYRNAKTQKNTTPVESGVKLMSREESTRIKEQITAVADQLNQMDIVCSVTTDGFVGMQKSDIAKTVEKEYAKFGKQVDRQNFGIILLEYSQINKALNYLYTEAEKAALLTVPKVLKRGIIADSHPDHKNRIKVDSFTIAAPVKINEKRGNVGVVVQRVDGTNRFKTLRILLPNGKAFEFEKMAEADSTAGSEPKPKRNGGVPIESASKKSIRDKSRIVKSESADAAVDAAKNQRNAKTQKNTTVTGGGNTLYMSRNIEDVTDDTVRQDLADIYTGNNVTSSSYIPLAKTTPFAVRYITQYKTDRPIIAEKKKAYFDMRKNGKFKEDKSHHYHGMGIDGYIDALAILSDPEFVIQEDKGDGKYHYAFISSNENGEEVCVVFQMNVSKPVGQMNGYPGGYYNLDITEFIATDEWLEEHGVEPGTSYKDFLLSFEGNNIAYDRSIHLEQLEKARNIDSESAGVAASYVNNRASRKSLPQPAAEVKKNSSLHSDRTDDSVSNRSLLANALEGVTQNEVEERRLQEYREQIGHLEEQERRLQELNAEIKKLSFSKGPRDTARIEQLREEAAKTANRIGIYDKRLLKLEAAKPLQQVLERERKKAYQRADQKNRDAMKAYRQTVDQRFDDMKAEYREKRKKDVESRHRTVMRHKVQRVVGELNQLLLSNDKKHHVPDSLKKAVADALALVNMDTVKAEERAAKYAALIAKETDPDKIDAYTMTMENILRQGEKMGQRLKELRDAYEEIQNSDDPDIANGYDPVISSAIQELSESIGSTSLADMSMEQLSDVYDMYKMVLTRVRDANKSLVASIAENITDRASRVIGEVRKVGGEHNDRVSGLDPVRSFSWDNEKPVYAMERIGSDALTEAYNNVRKGEDTWAIDVIEARAYYIDKSKKYGYDSWDFDKKYAFETTAGQKFELTLEQIMSLYAYSKREQADEHLSLGGFVFDSNIETHRETVKEKDGKTKRKMSILKYRVNTAEAHQLNTEILTQIIGTLSSEQMAFVDEMQDYLSSVMGAKGNEVTMKMYGVKLFKEKAYFPLKSAKQFMFEQNEVSGEVRIKNSGFTNKTKPKANNPIILSNFMDVWANHVNDMSMYHSFVLPLEDFNRIFNYNSPKQEGRPPVSVKGTIQSAYSPAAVNYVKQLITDLNGGAMADPRETTAKALMSKFKKAKVFASLSVFVQQPSAIGRAFAIINPKYFHFTRDGMTHDELWAEVKRYAPVAAIKEMGYFDTNMGKSTLDFIKAKEYTTFKEKFGAVFTDGDYRDGLISRLPALADELTWCAIWNAVKRETAVTHSNLATSSEAFLKTAGERFTEVITKTQVYDSVLARSANMRSKSALMSMATSFMAEPTTAINMLEDAIRKAQRGDKKYAAKVFASVAVSVILNNVLAALVYAGRDDDEDETFAEKYMQALVSGMLDDINPLTYYPFLKDMWSLLQGYSIERSDMSLMSDLAAAMKGIVTAYTSADGDIPDAWWTMAEAVANIGGIPMQNMRREYNAAKNFFNTIIEDINGRATTWGSMGDAIGTAARDSLPVVGWLPSKTKYDKIYDAIMSGDSVYVDRLKNGYKDESAYNSAVKKALRDNDPRIAQMAEAFLQGDYDGVMDIYEEIFSEKHFSHEIIKGAYESMVGVLDKDRTEEDVSYRGSDGTMFHADAFCDAILRNDREAAAAVRENMLQVMEEKEFASKVRSTVRELYDAGDINSNKAVSMMISHCGMEKEEAMAKVEYWEYKQEHPSEEVDDAWFDSYYTKAVDSGISIEDYVAYRKDRKGLEKKADILKAIDSQNLSDGQKDALYFAEGYAKSELYKTPWH